MIRLLGMLAALAVAASVAAAPAQAGTETFSFAPFGRIVLERSAARPAHVVLFLSGDGGWSAGVREMARMISRLDAVVAGIDVVPYLRHLGTSKTVCSYPAADLEALSKYIQKRLNFPRYVLPVLVGYSSGATVVYAALAQAPPNTFRGGISLSFCPSLSVAKPFCRGRGLLSARDPRSRGILFRPSAGLSAPWITLQGAIDRVCSAGRARAFSAAAGNAEFILLPKVGHGFSVLRNWAPQFRAAFARLVREDRTAPESPLASLPLVEIPAAPTGPDLLAVILSGDGGWAGLDREVGAALSARGVPVVGLNSLQYFWTPRTPRGAADDLARILRHYLLAWNKTEAVLVGYSFGADVLPFLADRLPAGLLDRVRLIALIGPGRTAEFEFHITEWLGREDGGAARPVLPEVEKLRGRRMLCISGSEERDSLCSGLTPGLAEVLRLPGGHHLGGRYAEIADIIMKRSGRTN